VPDRRGRLPLSLKVFSDADAARTICLLGPDAPASRAKRLRDRGVTVLPSAQTVQGFAWKPIFRDLAARGIHHILCEGGGKLAASLLRHDLIQEIFWIQAPRVLGRSGRPALDGVWSLDKAPPLVLDTVERVGDDVWFRLLPQGKD
jgi:diaminohydroxyphosphoribosylaminopyrimidine deaminase/5-amino-6-(5-phosphoribosylamino)uracil reductase